MFPSNHELKHTFICLFWSTVNKRGIHRALSSSAIIIYRILCTCFVEMATLSAISRTFTRYYEFFNNIHCYDHNWTSRACFIFSACSAVFKLIYPSRNSLQRWSRISMNFIHLHFDIGRPSTYCPCLFSTWKFYPFFWIPAAILASNDFTGGGRNNFNISKGD